MCGISVIVEPSTVTGFSDHRQANPELKARIAGSICARGSGNTAIVNFDQLWLAASVLHIQGNSATSQPYLTSSGNVLLWNGEAFGGLDGLDNPSLSDTTLVAAELDALPCTNTTEFGEAAVALFSKIHGPFALIYYCKPLEVLLFGRDSFGRRSLLRKLPSDRDGPNSLVLTSSIAIPAPSVEVRETWEEVPVNGLFLHAISGEEILIPWPASRVRLSRSSREAGRGVERAMRYGSPTAASAGLLDALRFSIHRRLNRLSPSLLSCAPSAPDSGACPVGVLFSGGIDSVLLAALLSEALHPSWPIDLLNVTFDEADAVCINASRSPSPDRLAAVSAVMELQKLVPTRPWRLVHIDVDSAERERHERRIMTLMAVSTLCVVTCSDYCIII